MDIIQKQTKNFYQLLLNISYRCVKRVIRKHPFIVLGIMISQHIKSITANILPMMFNNLDTAVLS